MRWFFAAAFALLAAQSAVAETLQEAMASAMETNPTLAAQRERVRATREALPQAWAQALPQLSLSAGATASDSYGAGSGDRVERWTGGVSASQLLFASGGVLASTRQARAQIAASLANYEDARQQLLLDVTSAYAGMRQAQAVVQARQITVDNLTEQQRYANAQFEAGVITRTDVALSQARLARARTQLVQAQGTLAASNEAYVRLVGHPPSNLTEPVAVTGLPNTLQDALDLAVRQNPDLVAAQATARQAEAAVDVARSNSRPRVTLEGSSNVGQEFDDDLSRSSGDSLGVRVAIPIFNGGLDWSRIRQQRALRSAANLDVSSVQRVVRETVTNAWTGLISARAAVVSAQEQVTASELALRGVRLEQETGLRATVEVLDTEQDLLDARILLAQAQRDLVVAERQLLASVGALTPQS